MSDTFLSFLTFLGDGVLNNHKVSVIGAGNVGATICYQLAMKNLCSEIVLIDLLEDMAIGKSLDLTQAAAASGSATKINATTNYEAIKDSKLVIITAGSPRKPGMSRDDLLMINAKITRAIIENVKTYAPDSVVITVANPLDAVTYIAWRDSGFPRERVIGMAGILDSSRMAALIAQETGIGYGQVQATVLGGHGDDMVPLPRLSTVNGVAVTELISEKAMDGIIEKTRKGGAEIVKYLGTSAYYAPANSTVVMAEAILNDTHALLPCAVLLDGEYGEKDVVNGVPVVLGKDGVEKIIELKLTNEEHDAFKESVGSVRNLLTTLNNNHFFDN